MATLTENKGSGSGDSIGVDQKSRSREFTLIIDSLGGDWHAPFLAILPLHEFHPKDRTISVLNHRMVSQEGPLIFVVAADYGVQSNSGLIASGWTISAGSNTGSERIFQEIADPDNPNTKGKVIGPRRYFPDAAGQFQAITIKDDKKATLRLAAIDDMRRPDGMDIVSGDTAFTLTRTFTRMTLGRIREAANFKRSVNRNDFPIGVPGAFEEGNVLFVSWSIDERIGTLPNEERERFLYDVELQFLYNPKGHTPEARNETHVSSDGFESPVTAFGTTNVERQTFRKYLAGDLDSLLGIFEA